MEEPVKRKRGRPRKNPLPEQTIDTTVEMKTPEMLAGDVSYKDAARRRQETAIADNARFNKGKHDRRERNRMLAREVALIGRRNKMEMLARTKGAKAEEAKAEAEKLAALTKEVQAQHRDAERKAHEERVRAAEDKAKQLAAMAEAARQEAERLKDAGADN